MALSRLTTGTLATEGAVSSTLSLTWPTSGITSSSFAVLTVNLFENNNNTDCNTPSGFTLQSTSGGDVYSGSAAQESKTYVFTKECAGTESGGITITTTAGTSLYWCATLDVYNGTNDLTFASISAVNLASGSTDASAPSVSGTAGQGLICVFNLSDPPGTTNSGPSGMTVGTDQTGGSTNSARNYYVDLSSTGATGTKTWDFTNTRDSASYSLLIDGASSTAPNVTPGVGSLVITGQVPTVAKGGDYPISPGVGSIAITGNAPRVELRQKVQPLIEAADSNVSGSNTASSTWAVVHPAMSAGDLGIAYIAWDDSTNVTSVVAPTAPGGEAFTAFTATPITDSATETRANFWWVKAAADWSASSVAFKPSSGTESWSATWVRVPKGEFDPNTPIGAAIGIGSASTSAVTSPSVNAGVSDGQGTMLWFVGVDTDPMSASVVTAGWTTLETQDLGSVAHAVARRDAPVANSAAYSAGAFVWNMAGTNQDTWTGILAIVRAPPVPEEVYPESGSVVITGQVPTVEVPATGSYNANTLSGALTLTGQVPTVTRDYAVATGVGSIALTGVVPAVAVGVTGYTVNTLTGSLTITGVAPDQTFETDPPGSGQLVITGQVPTVSVGAVPVNVSTLAGALTITGVAPSVTRDFSVATGVGSITLTGVAPAATRDFSVNTGVGAITLTGVVPTVDVGLVPVDVPTFAGSLTISGQVPTVLASLSVATLAGSLTITGVAPVVTRDHTASTLAGSLTISGQAPTVATGDSPNIATASGSIVLAGVAPAITRDYTVETAAGSLAISGKAPTIARDYTVQTFSGELILAGYVPVLQEAGSWNVIPPSGQIIYGGEPPEVVNSGDPLPSRKKEAGGVVRSRYRQRFVVEIDGETFEVTSFDEARELLETAKDTAEEVVAEVIAKPAAKKPPLPRIRVRGTPGPELTELVSEVAAVRTEIREIYARMQRDMEIGALLRQIDDDEAISVLLA